MLLIKWMNLFHIMKKVLFVSFSLFVLHEIMLKDISLAHKILNLKAFSWLVVLDIEFRISDIDSRISNFKFQILNLEFRISNFRYWISNFESRMILLGFRNTKKDHSKFEIQHLIQPIKRKLLNWEFFMANEMSISIIPYRTN